MKDFPTELWNIIFFKIPVEQRMKNVAPVCKTFYQIANSEHIWKAECIAEKIAINEGQTPKQAYLDKFVLTKEDKNYYIVGENIRLTPSLFKQLLKGGRLIPIDDNTIIKSFPKEGSIRIFEKKSEAVSYAYSRHVDDRNQQPHSPDEMRSAHEQIDESPAVFTVYLKGNLKFERIREPQQPYRPLPPPYFEANLDIVKRILSAELTETMDYNKVVQIDKDYEPENNRNCLIM